MVKFLNMDIGDGDYIKGFSLKIPFEKKIVFTYSNKLWVDEHKNNLYLKINGGVLYLFNIAIGIGKR